jgi:hypothetical protein
VIRQELFLDGWAGFLSMCSSDCEDNNYFRVHSKCTLKSPKEIAKRGKFVV